MTPLVHGDDIINIVVGNAWDHVHCVDKEICCW